MNRRLKKPEFDCAHLSDEYDCGCGDEPINAKTTQEPGPNDKYDPMDLEDDSSRDTTTGADMIRGGR